MFADSINEYAATQAVISAVIASTSGVLGGRLADSLATEGLNRRLWIPVVGSALAAPAWYFAIHTAPESFAVSMTWLAIEYLVAESWFGATISTLQVTVGPLVGGTAQGLFTMTGAVANLAPTLVGYANEDLENSLAAAVCFGYIASAVCFGLAINAPDTTVDNK